jgi:hypothetical protein
MRARAVCACCAHAGCAWPPAVPACLQKGDVSCMWVDVRAACLQGKGAWVSCGAAVRQLPQLFSPRYPPLRRRPSSRRRLQRQRRSPRPSPPLIRPSRRAARPAVRRRGPRRPPPPTRRRAMPGRRKARARRPTACGSSTCSATTAPFPASLEGSSRCAGCCGPRLAPRKPAAAAPYKFRGQLQVRGGQAACSSPQQQQQHPAAAAAVAHSPRERTAWRAGWRQPAGAARVQQLLGCPHPTPPHPTPPYPSCVQSSVTCHKCGSRSTQYEPFWDLQLPLAKEGEPPPCLWHACLRI